MQELSPKRCATIDHGRLVMCVTVPYVVEYSVSGRKRKSEEATGETTDKKLKLEVNHYITMMSS